MEVVCEYCENGFSSKTNLLNHQKTSKYCLEIRGVDSKTNICINCEKDFSTVYTLCKHQKTCDATQTNLRLIEKIKKLEKAVAEKDLALEEKDAMISDYELILSDRNAVMAEQDSDICNRDVEIEALKLKYRRKFKKLKQAHAKLEIELEKERATVGVYKKNFGLTTPKLTSPQSRLDRVKVSKTFFGTTDGVLARLPTEYKFAAGLDGLIEFITPIIKEGKFRCYTRTDPTRPHYHKFDGTSWIKDCNGLFIREILDVMAPHVKACLDKHFADYAAESDLQKKDDMSQERYRVQPTYDGIIHSNCNERNVLVSDIGVKLAQITDI
jgi:hypothetical protein